MKKKRKSNNRIFRLEEMFAKDIKDKILEEEFEDPIKVIQAHDKYERLLNIFGKLNMKINLELYAQTFNIYEAWREAYEKRIGGMN